MMMIGKKLLLLLLFIPLMSIGQDDITLVESKTNISSYSNTENELVLSNEKTTINVTINTGEYLTNLIHILNLIFDSIGFKKVNNCKLTIDKVLKSKVKGYDEILGKLSFNTRDNYTHINISSKKIKDIFKIKIKDRTKSVIYLNSKLKLIKKHNNKLEKFDFPLSSVFTEKIYQNINIEKYPYKFINYKYAKDLSILILNLFVKKSIKNIAIR